MLCSRRSLVRVAVALGTLSTHAQAQVPAYTLTDVGPIYAAGTEYVVGVNDLGQVTATTPNRQAFVWDAGQVTVLPPLEPANFGYPHDLTNGGVVIGDGMIAVQSHATIWQSGVPLDLGALGGVSSHAVRGNESGQLVGWWQLAGGGVEIHAFLYDAGTFTDLGGLGGVRAYAKAINATGTVAGFSWLTNDVGGHAFVWSAGTMTDIAAWSGADRASVANAINDEGVVVGTIEAPFGNDNLAFVYENGQMSTLPGFPGAQSSVPEAINNLRQVAGWTQYPTGGPFATLFQNGLAYDLNTMIPSGSGWQLLGASDINDSGQIVGLGIYQGTAHAFLLTPNSIVGRFCTSTVNSTGSACTIDCTGLPSVALNQFDLVATGAVPNAPGLFFYNSGQMQVPFGNGYLCVGGGAPAIFRLGPPAFSNGTGVAVRHVDFDTAPAGSGPGAILPLATWNFQYYYRDQAAGGARFNLSDAISVTFVP